MRKYLVKVCRKRSSLSRRVTEHYRGINREKALRLEGLPGMQGAPVVGGQGTGVADETGKPEGLSLALWP